MKKTSKQKVKGRPSTGITPLMGFRADPAIRASIVKWAERQPDTPTAPARKVSKPGRRLRAQELAKAAIEKIIDPAIPPEERDHRRRRLTKGPTEFREDRVDQPKPKR